MTGRTVALVALGSNIDPACNVPQAVHAISRHPAIDLQAVSPVYRTPPAGGLDGHPEFRNAAVRVATELSAAELRAELRAIEARMGRVRTTDKNAPRPIDLDIAYFGDQTLDLGGTVIPDPDVARYPHLARPLADVAPDWVDPGTGRSLAALAADLDPLEPEALRMTPQIVPFDRTGRYADELDGQPDEVYSPRFEKLVTEMLVELGEDPGREGLERTPLRVAKALDFLTSGYTTTLDDVVNNAVFEEPFDEMVLVKDVEFYSLCEHHLLPFVGKANVAYLPNGKIIGLSKIARIVDLYARRLQVQERLTNQVADGLMQVLEPHGVAVVLEASHFCMMMRGVQKQGSSMVTSAMRGTFTDNARTRAEFLELIKD